MLTMSTLMMPSPAMTAMSTSTPLPVVHKLEAAAKLSLNHNASGNKAGICFIICVSIYIYTYISR